MEGFVENGGEHVFSNTCFSVADKKAPSASPQLHACHPTTPIPSCLSFVSLRALRRDEIGLNYAEGTVDKEMWIKQAVADSKRENSD